MPGKERAMPSAVRRKPFRVAVKPYLFLLPMCVFAVAFCYYPALKTLLFSVSTVNFRGEITEFAPPGHLWDNFRYLFSRRDFAIALQNTLKLTLINTPVTVVLSLLFALMCFRRRPLSGVSEMLFTLPMAVSMAAAALIFKVLLNPTVGIVNLALGLKIGWYEDKNTAMAGVLMLTVWMGLGFNFLLFLSALRGIPSGVLDSAQLDGAGPLRRFFSIQLPLISPTVFYVFCSNMILAMLTSGPIIIITDGGPARATTTLIFMMYSSGYGSSNYSLAACISVCAFLLTLLFTIGAFWLEGKKVQYE